MIFLAGKSLKIGAIIAIATAVLAALSAGLYFAASEEGSPGASPHTGPSPNCPADVQAISLPDGSIRLTWSAFPEAKHYKIDRAEGSGAFEDDYATVSAPGTEVLDNMVTLWETYQYRVRADNSGGNAEGCPVVTVRSELGCVEGVSATARPDGSIRVAWDAFPDAEYYVIDRSVGGSAYAMGYATVHAPGTAFIDTNTTEGEVYQYRVRADFSAQDCAGVQATAVPFFSGPLIGAVAVLGGVGAYVVIRQRRRA